MRRIILAMLLAGLLAIPANASIFIDDEQQASPQTAISYNYMISTLIPQGTMAFDTNVKFTGTGSLRLNYPSNCQTLTTANQCGGSATYTLPSRQDEIYVRFYFRMSGSATFGATNVTTDGKFHVAAAYTKMFKTQANQVGSNVPRSWIVMGQQGSKNLTHQLENNPSPGAVRVIPTTKTLQDNTFYCIEFHQKMNTPGLPNGVDEVWVDGVLVGSAYNVLFRNTGGDIDLQWDHLSIFRQIGEGNTWYDRTAVGNTRIGCVGVSSGDSTAPATPLGWTIH